MLRREHRWSPNLTLSIGDGVFCYLIVETWQEKAASDQSGPSGSGKPPSHPRTAPTQSLRNVRRLNPGVVSWGRARGPGGCRPQRVASLGISNGEASGEPRRERGEPGCEVHRRRQDPSRCEASTARYSPLFTRTATPSDGGRTGTAPKGTLSGRPRLPSAPAGLFSVSAWNGQPRHSVSHQMTVSPSLLSEPAARATGPQPGGWCTR